MGKFGKTVAGTLCGIVLAGAIAGVGYVGYKKLDEKNKQIDDLTTENITLKDENETVSKALEESKQELSTKTAELETAQNSLTVATTKMAELDTKIDGLNGQITEKDEQIAAEQTLNAQYQSAVIEIDKKLDSESDLETIEDLTETKNSILTSIENSNAKIATLEDEKASLKSQADALTSEKTELETQVSDLQNQVNTLTSKVATLEQQIEGYANSTGITYQYSTKESSVLMNNCVLDNLDNVKMSVINKSSTNSSGADIINDIELFDAGNLYYSYTEYDYYNVNFPNGTSSGLNVPSKNISPSSGLTISKLFINDKEIDISDGLSSAIPYFNSTSYYCSGIYINSISMDDPSAGYSLDCDIYFYTPEGYYEDDEGNYVDFDNKESNIIDDLTFNYYTTSYNDGSIQVDMRVTGTIDSDDVLHFTYNGVDYSLVRTYHYEHEVF